MAYVRYHPLRAPSATTVGWDAWAADYARLGQDNAGYALGKRLLHEIVEELAPRFADRPTRVLDFNCGAGEDVARFLARGWRVDGCDGSPGMLRQAAIRCASELADEQLRLWLGQADELEPNSFASRFDLIFSAIGGFAYLDDAEFVRVHRALAGMLTPGGVMVLAHLTPFCLAETAYHLSRLAPRAATRRWRGVLPIEVRGQPLKMHLRSARQVGHLLAETVRIERQLPLLVLTPPFQSGFRPSPRVLTWLEPVERVATKVPALTAVADQAVCIARQL